MSVAAASPSNTQFVTLTPERVALASFAQRRLWFMQQLQSGGTAYNLPIAWRLKGCLDVAAFERSIAEIVRRHASLRTTFAEVDGELKQIVWSVRPVSILKTEAGGMVDRERGALRLIEEEIHTPFDLERGPLFRARLITLSETEHIALFNAHHILWDGWSIEVFRRELTALYEGFCQGTTPSVPELPMQYVDLAQEERGAAQGREWDASLNYWKNKLRGPLPVLALPADHARSGAGAKAAVMICNLGAELTKSLRALGRKHGATLFMTLLAGFKALLHRYTGEEDVLVGSPISGRDRAEAENLIGFFVNTLALRTDLGGDPTFSELLGRIRETTLGAYAHQEIPFERVIRELQPERSGNPGAPVIQVVFGFEGGNTHEWPLGELRASVENIPSPGVKFDWTFLLEETDCGLKGSLEYNTDLFGAGTIERFLQHFQIFLRETVAKPDRRISEIPLLTDGERQLFTQWNQTATEYERNATVQELFEAQARKTPDAIALVYGDRQMSYGELNQRADRLAKRLNGSGVGPDVLVGICLKRSVEMIVAILGVLKAGGAYVPLDRNYPRERMEFMLQDANIRVLLTDTDSREEMRSLAPDCEIICVDEAYDGGEAPSRMETPHSENLAYVMYTSGSTGQPKGVAVPHRGIVRLVRNTNYADFSAQDVFLQLAPISFDASTFEIWGALLNGARLVIFPSHVPSLEELGRTIRQHGVTILWLTAGLFHQMVDDQIESLKSVRQLLAGGDVLSVKQVMKARKELPHCRIINGYGPTENTTFTCCYRVPQDWNGGPSVPIGRPVSNTEVHVLDNNSCHVPIGVPGELCIGGDGLARGYLNSPELTNARFISNPSNPRQRLYRTGDVARWLPDGNLEFLGRKDLQMKIRGHRIELGEIEATLASHPSVSQGAVIAKDDRSGIKQLIAFIVWRGAEAFEETALREFAGRKLPQYVVPARFIELPELPLTPNGKVDRRTLSQIETTPVRKTLAPRNETEKALAQIWSEVLGFDSIGSEDNFFHIGGHSLLATQVISRIAKKFRVELPISALFEAPTIEALAQRISAAASTTVRESHITPQILPDRAKQLLSQLENLSDAEIEALLQSSELNQVSS